MTDLQVQIFIALVTILGSGVVAALVNHLFVKEREKQSFLKNKAESLFISYDRYAKRLYSNHFCEMSVMLGLNRDSLEKAKEGTEKDDGSDYTQIQMLIGLYFPHMEEAWLYTLKSRNNMVKIWSQNLKKRYTNQPEMDKERASELKDLLREFDDARKEFLKQLSTLVRKL